MISSDKGKILVSSLYKGHGSDFVILCNCRVHCASKGQGLHNLLLVVSTGHPHMMLVVCYGLHLHGEADLAS